MHIYGSMTIQGLLGYYFNELKLTHVELNRCMVNQIADNPRRTTFHRLFPHASATVQNANATWEDTTCKDGRENCDDVQCQNWPIENTTLVHYTHCNPAKSCVEHRAVEDREYLDEYACQDMHEAWFRMRHSLEKKLHNVTSNVRDPSAELWEGHIHLGYCEAKGQYKGVDLPEDLPTEPL